MYVIVQIAGMQYKVSQGRFVYVPRLEQKEGEDIIFNHVLFLDQNGNITIGAPAIEGMQVKGKILAHLKADKVTVFKKKRRKGYKLKRGHRQQLTKLEIVSIGTTTNKKKVSKKSVSESSETVNKQDLENGEISSAAKV
ncbi:50S ribosomal protein L21 [Bacteroidetes bacterium endosymbiont of Geopemphigus sp.]|uniref:50S ribosomal protein L21 n=1 Tax=Bacteroidetes bacterium endosymbiont of Geopemphigus sp. TaxID=2047937 RepID=UPI000CD048FE|nr:50S ribosomal protein L21 [Bacteroidetes bacterium endosymbiont of Geopemphigus sp.]